MRCRCMDITACREDIETVSDMLRVTQQMDAENDGTLTPTFQNMAGGMQNAVSPANIVGLCSGIRQANNKLSLETQAIAGLCEAKRIWLEAELQAMENEDRAFHAAESEE